MTGFCYVALAVLEVDQADLDIIDFQASTIITYLAKATFYKMCGRHVLKIIFGKSFN